MLFVSSEMRDDNNMVEEEDPYLTISSHSTTLSSRIHTLEKPIHQLRACHFMGCDRQLLFNQSR